MASPDNMQYYENSEQKSEPSLNENFSVVDNIILENLHDETLQQTMTSPHAYVVSVK